MMHENIIVTIIPSELISSRLRTLGGSPLSAVGIVAT
tara:strand:+ start:878 stop:988 length:111 start_codon:yes stop_codon:yes gene_type:complete